MNYKLIDNIEFDGINYKDSPDFSDVFITNACYDGIEMTDKQLDEINEDSNFVHEKFLEKIF